MNLTPFVLQLDADRWGDFFRKKWEEKHGNRGVLVRIKKKICVYDHGPHLDTSNFLHIAQKF